MPSAYIKKIAKEKDMTVSAVEKVWDKSVAAAEKQGKKNNYAYTMGIFKQKMKIKDKKK